MDEVLAEAVGVVEHERCAGEQQRDRRHRDIHADELAGDGALLDRLEAKGRHGCASPRVSVTETATFSSSELSWMFERVTASRLTRKRT